MVFLVLDVKEILIVYVYQVRAKDLLFQTLKYIASYLAILKYFVSGMVVASYKPI